MQHHTSTTAPAAPHLVQLVPVVRRATAHTECRTITGGHVPQAHPHDTIAAHRTEASR
jgi:hypothetical protein